MNDQWEQRYDDLVGRLEQLSVDTSRLLEKHKRSSGGSTIPTPGCIYMYACMPIYLSLPF